MEMLASTGWSKQLVVIMHWLAGEWIHIIMPHQASSGDNLIGKLSMWWHNLKSNYGRKSVFSHHTECPQHVRFHFDNIYWTHWTWWLSIHFSKLFFFLFISTVRLPLKKRVKFNKIQIKFHTQGNPVQMVPFSGTFTNCQFFKSC